MTDWKAQLEKLNRELLAKERAEQERKAAVLKHFRSLLDQLEPVVKTAAEFGDAFGAPCAWEISRFDDRYPFLEFRILRPPLEYRVECRDGVLWERLREGGGAAREQTTNLEALQPREFEKKIMKWVQDAANANRKVPGRRR
ncbi:MAG TPA: hypothetical protein VIL07_07485 [Symbiobacteriaceae bacterium]